MNVTRRGFTIIEATISGVILLIAIGVALSLFVDANRSVGESLHLTEVAVNANQLESMIRQELRGSGDMRLGATQAGVFALGATTTSPAGQFTSLQYRLVTGFDPNLPGAVLGPVRELRFVYEPHRGKLQGLRVELEYVDWQVFDQDFPRDALTEFRAIVNYSVPLL